MIKEPGMFSNRHFPRKGKQNTNDMNKIHQADQNGFPSAYSSNKTISKERNSISVHKKRQEQKKIESKIQQQQKNEQLIKAQKQLKDAKDQMKRMNKQVSNRYNQYQNHIQELQKQLKQKERLEEKFKESLKDQMKKVKMESQNSNRYKQTIKKQIIWLLHLFKMLEYNEISIQDVKREISKTFIDFKEYICQFNIEKELQSLASVSTISQHSNTSSLISKHLNVMQKKNLDSIFTEDLEEGNMIKIMELPLIETFNNQQYCQQESQKQNDKMERITKKLFNESPLFKEQTFNQSHTSVSGDQDQIKIQHQKGQTDQNQFLQVETKQLDLPRQVIVTKSFEPDDLHDNYISLKKGEALKLLRKIRNNLWIGEYGQKIGLVLEEYFSMR